MKTYKLPLVAFILIMGVLIVLLNSQLSLAAPTVTLTTPGAAGETLPEVSEFATDVLGDPWDMNETSDLAYYRGDLANGTFANGLFTANLTKGQGNERLTLLSAGAVNHTALRVGKIGYNFPINADKYRFLTFRIYKSCVSCNSGYVQWFADDTYKDSVMGAATPYSLSSGAGWYIVTVDLKSSLWIGEKPWSGTIRELVIHPFGGGDDVGATVKLDWARLTVENPKTSRPYTINWTDGNGSYDIYASLGDKALDGNDILLAEAVNGSAGSFTVQTGVLPAGTYFIGVDTGSGVVWSSGALNLNSPPQSTILKPSKTSGEEYSESVLGNAWDMDQSNDMNDSLPHGWETCVSNPSFSGIYRATLTGCSTDNVFTDARLILGHMNTPPVFDPPIDTHKYRYFSFRYRLEGEQDVRRGWVSRFGWWQHGAGGTTEADVISRDIILSEGWNTYKVDLWAPDIVDEAHPVQRSWLDSSPNRLRFDPAELYLSLLPRSFELDWIKLTAMDKVKQGDTFPIEYEVSESNSVDLTFYYDTDTNPANGRSLIGETNKMSAVENPVPQNTNADEYFVYLPMIANNYYPCAGNCFPWDTSTVTSGTYFVCIEAQDAYDSTYRCSEAPVVVSP